MRYLSLVILITVFLVSFPNSVLAVSSFPDAEGFGANSVGGRGGTVFEVTNTNDSGIGSLRACVIASGPRTCVFKVGGLIVLNSTLVIANPYITIAGQTAPGGGITLRTASGGDVFSTRTHDVIIRYITLRPGPGGENHANQMAKNGSSDLYNIIVDHNSISWGVDSNIETWYRTNNVTIQWSLISEALDCSTHSKGCHSKGLMIGGYKGSESGGIGTENVSVINNIMSQNADRNPLIQMCGVAQVVNNVTYNAKYTYSHQQLNCTAGSSYVNWINNYHKKGSNGSQTDLKIIPSDDGPCSDGKVYMSGNVGNNGNWSYGFNGSCDAKKANIITSTPASGPSIATTNANDAYTNTIADGGAGNSRGLNCNGTWFNRRDSIDTRVINDIKNGTGKIINNPSDVGGWITPATGTGCTDTDHDGMPDSWESAKGLNPNSASDGSSIALNGYTNLENYLNGGSELINPTYDIADVEPDGDVDQNDLLSIISNFGLTGIIGWLRSDIVQNGKIDIFDFNRVLSNFGNSI